MDHITQLEKIKQQSSTKHDTGMHHMPYQTHSLQRRRKGDYILYDWKFIEGLVPNISNPITSTFSEHRVGLCVNFHVNVGCVGNMAYNSNR